MAPYRHADGGRVQGSLVNRRASGCRSRRRPASLLLASSPAPWGPLCHWAHVPRWPLAQHQPLASQSLATRAPGASPDVNAGRSEREVPSRPGPQGRAVRPQGSRLGPLVQAGARPGSTAVPASPPPPPGPLQCPVRRPLARPPPNLPPGRGEASLGWKCRRRLAPTPAGLSLSLALRTPRARRGPRHRLQPKPSRPSWEGRTRETQVGGTGHRGRGSRVPRGGTGAVRSVRGESQPCAASGGGGEGCVCFGDVLLCSRHWALPGACARAPGGTLTTTGEGEVGEAGPALGFSLEATGPRGGSWWGSVSQDPGGARAGRGRVEGGWHPRGRALVAGTGPRRACSGVSGGRSRGPGRSRALPRSPRLGSGDQSRRVLAEVTSVYVCFVNWAPTCTGT